MISEISFNIQQFFREELADSLNSSNSKGFGEDASTEIISREAHPNADQEVLGW